MTYSKARYLSMAGAKHPTLCIHSLQCMVWVLDIYDEHNSCVKMNGNAATNNCKLCNGHYDSQFLEQFNNKQQHSNVA